MAQKNHKPLIAVSMCTIQADEWHGPHAQPGHQDLAAIGKKYLTAIERAGGLPLPIPNDRETAARLLDTVDGVVLSGGQDIDPTLYHASSGLARPDIERDQVEFLLTQRALERSLPILGICRGAQMINVALGGTLHAEINAVWPDATSQHMQDGLKLRHHSVRVTAGSQLAALLPERTFIVASDHHQSIDKVATPLKVVASSQEGIVEAVEATAHPFVIGVQWHPEREGQSAQSRALFSALVKACQPAPARMPAAWLSPGFRTAN